MTLTLAQTITVAVLAVSMFFCGWFLYRLRAKSREADLQRLVREAKGLLPQLESTVHKREQRIASLSSELDHWKERLPVLEANVKEREREVLARDRALRALNAELTLLRATDQTPRPAMSEAAAANAPADTAVADAAKARMESLEREIERNKEEIVKWHARVPKLVDSLRERDVQLAEIVAQNAETAEANARLRLQLTDNEHLLADKTRSLEEREVRIGELSRGVDEARGDFSKKLATSIRLGREEIDRMSHELGGELERLTREVGEAITRRNESTEEKVELRGRLAARATEHEQAVARIDALTLAVAGAEEARDGAMRQSAAAIERNGGLDAEVELLTRRRNDLEGDLGAALERLRAAEVESSQRDTEQRAIAAQLVEREAELGRLHEQRKQWHANVGPLEELIRQRDAALGERAQRIESLQDQLSKLEVSVTDRAQRIATLEREAATHAEARMPPSEKVEYLEQRSAAQFEKNRELASALDAREKTIANLERDALLKDKSLAVLWQQLERLREANERLSTQARSLRSGGSSESGSLPPPTDPGSNVAPVRPSGLHASRPEQVDDLQQIRGIGAAFQHRLNELGIYEFRQIAGLQEAEIVWIENELRMFRGRIGRDDWLGQALDLLAATEWLPGMPVATSQSLGKV